MATITSPAASVAATSMGSAPNMLKTFVTWNEVDLKTIAAANGDVVEVLPIAAGTFVSQVFVEVVRAAAGTTATAKVGDGGDDDGFDTSVDLKGTAGTVTYNGVGSVTGTGAATTDGTANVLTDAFAAGKFYSDADTIDLTVALNTVTDAGKVRVTAVCYNI